MTNLTLNKSEILKNYKQGPCIFGGIGDYNLYNVKVHSTIQKVTEK